MRYRIINSEVQESFYIDAPYDTKADAEYALEQGMTHNCEYCDGLGECLLTSKED